MSGLDPTEVRASVEYQLVATALADRRAARSGVPYMAHVDEGVALILDMPGGTTWAARAFCLHPLLQDDLAFVERFEQVCRRAPARSVALAIEYRHTANAFLSPMESHPGYEDAARIATGVVPEVRHMLIADKLQNWKDFRRFHLGTHPRRGWLQRYFAAWLDALTLRSEPPLQRWIDARRRAIADT